MGNNIERTMSKFEEHGNDQKGVGNQQSLVAWLQGLYILEDTESLEGGLFS